MSLNTGMSRTSMSWHVHDVDVILFTKIPNKAPDLDITLEVVSLSDRHGRIYKRQLEEF